jgi:hypothetical protein
MQRLSNEATEQLKKAPSAALTAAPPVYPTYGVHNPAQYSPCAAPDCLYGRGPGEPSDFIVSGRKNQAVDRCPRCIGCHNLSTSQDGRTIPVCQFGS